MLWYVRYEGAREGKGGGEVRGEGRRGAGNGGGEVWEKRETYGDRF